MTDRLIMELEVSNRDQFLRWLQQVSETEQEDLIIGYRAGELVTRREVVTVLPPSLHRLQQDLMLFFAGMVRKLDLNSHKQTPEREQVSTMIELLRGELQELEDQLAEDQYDPNALVEAQDVANFAFLIFVALRGDDPVSGLDGPIKYPSFVTCYQPTGQAGLLAGYGKFVYQRQFRGVTVRSECYDTPQLAAVEGRKSWQQQVQVLAQHQERPEE